MEGAFEFENLFFAGESTCRSHGLEACVGTASSEDHLFGAGYRADEFFGKFHCFVVSGEEGAAELNRFDNGLCDCGICVPENHGA